MTQDCKYSKGQLARVFDILLIGPLMIYYGYTSSDSKLLGSIMMSIGVSTIIYNFQNFISNIIPNLISNTNDIYFGVFTVFLAIIIYFINN